MTAIYKEEYLRHLGIYFRLKGLTQDVIETNLLASLQRKFQSWFHIKMCLIRKIVVLNVFMYSKMWYAARITPFTHAFKEPIRELTRRFL